MPFEIKALLVEPLPKHMEIEGENFTPLDLALCFEHLKFFCLRCTRIRCRPTDFERLEGPVNEIRTGFKKLKQELDKVLGEGGDDKRKKLREQIERKLSSRLIELDEPESDELKESKHR